MEKAKKLIEELTLTKQEVANGVGVSSQLIHKFEGGNYKGKTLAKRIGEYAKTRGELLIRLAKEAELEAA
jgi:DNA-binding XRE family transcriptional regulator